MRTRAVLLLGAAAALATTAYAAGIVSGGPDPAATPTAMTASEAQSTVIPASGAEASQRLAASPRRGEWAVIRVGSDSVRAWVVYPERRENAPVVVAVHDNQGLSNWIRAVADQLAADGFIGIAPDLLTMKNVAQRADGESDPAGVRAVIGQLDQATRDRYIQAVGEWGTRLQGASRRYGIVGFCWGGSTVFAHAVAAPPTLGAVVVYYGTSPETVGLASVRAPVLGLYGGADARVNATIPPADSALKAMGRTYEQHIFDGAGHGFLRGQEGQNGANLEASKKAWPLTVGWLRKHLAG